MVGSDKRLGNNAAQLAVNRNWMKMIKLLLLARKAEVPVLQMNG